MSQEDNKEINELEEQIAKDLEQTQQEEVTEEEFQMSQDIINDDEEIIWNGL